MNVQNPQIFTFQSREKVSGCLYSRPLLCLPSTWHTSTMFHIHIQCLVNLKLKFWIKSCCLIWIHVHKQAWYMSNITVPHASFYITIISIKIQSRLYIWKLLLAFSGCDKATDLGRRWTCAQPPSAVGWAWFSRACIPPPYDWYLI